MQPSYVMNGKMYKRASETGKSFLNILAQLQKRYDAVIHAFCLMDNHYHFLIETPSGNFPGVMRQDKFYVPMFSIVVRLKVNFLQDMGK